MAIMIACTNPNCGYTGPANVIHRHFDGKRVIRCPRCCAVNSELKITGFNSQAGETFGKMKVSAGARMTVIPRGGSEGAE